MVGIQADNEDDQLTLYNGVNVDAAVAASLSNSTLTLSYRGVDESAAKCGGLGYNLTSLAGRDLVYNGLAGQQITLSICGVVQDSQCSATPAGDRSMLCQEVLDANQNTVSVFMVSEWKPSSV